MKEPCCNEVFNSPPAVPDETFVRVMVDVPHPMAVWGSVTDLYYGVCIPRQIILIHPADAAADNATEVKKTVFRFRTGDVIHLLASIWPWKPKKCHCVSLRNRMNLFGPRWSLRHAKAIATAMTARFRWQLLPVLIAVFLCDSIIATLLGDR